MHGSLEDEAGLLQVTSSVWGHWGGPDLIDEVVGERPCHGLEGSHR